MSLELLSGVREKIIRVEQHLNVLRSEEAEYVVTETYGIRKQFEDHIPEKTGRSGITWRSNLNPPPPPRLAVLCGDCLYQLRSALDHLAWALVLVDGGTPSAEHPVTQFPIYEDRLSEKGKIRTVTIAGGISAAAETLIEGLQPYHRVEDPSLHPLALLRYLSNIDKHRTLNVIAIDLGKVKITDPKRQTVTTGRGGPFVDGALIHWVLSENPAFDPNVDVNIQYSPRVAFSDFGPPSMELDVEVVQLLSNLLDFVRDSVIQRCARQFFGGALTF